MTYAICPNCGEEAEFRHGICNVCGEEVKLPPKKIDLDEFDDDESWWEGDQ